MQLFLTTPNENQRYNPRQDVGENNVENNEAQTGGQCLPDSKLIVPRKRNKIDKSNGIENQEDRLWLRGVKELVGQN